MRTMHSATIWRVIMVSVIVWGSLIFISSFFNPIWPPTNDKWINALLAVVIVEFLSIKVWTMVRNTNIWTALGSSLIAVNAALIPVYVLAVATGMWPVLDTMWWLKTIVRSVLLVAIFFSIYELLIVSRDREYPRWKANIILTVVALVVVMVTLFRLGFIFS